MSYIWVYVLYKEENVKLIFKILVCLARQSMFRYEIVVNTISHTDCFPLSVLNVLVDTRLYVRIIESHKYDEAEVAAVNNKTK